MVGPHPASPANLRRSISERKAAAARKELIRRFPERDLDSRVPVTKQIADLEPGDVVEYPAAGDAEDHDGPQHVIFTGFTEIGGRDFVGICDLDGFGTRTVDLPMSDEVTAYVLPTTEA